MAVAGHIVVGEDVARQHPRREERARRADVENGAAGIDPHSHHLGAHAALRRGQVQFGPSRRQRGREPLPTEIRVGSPTLPSLAVTRRTSWTPTCVPGLGGNRCGSTERDSPRTGLPGHARGLESRLELTMRFLSLASAGATTATTG